MSFQSSVNAIKKQIKEFFAEQARGGKIIAGVGAAAKGNTLINFVGLGVDEIRFVFDSAKSKQGKFLPGSHIPTLESGTFPKYNWTIACIEILKVQVIYLANGAPRTEFIQ